MKRNSLKLSTDRDSRTSCSPIETLEYFLPVTRSVTFSLIKSEKDEVCVAHECTNQCCVCGCSARFALQVGTAQSPGSSEDNLYKANNNYVKQSH